MTLFCICICLLVLALLISMFLDNRADDLQDEVAWLRTENRALRLYASELRERLGEDL